VQNAPPQPGHRTCFAIPASSTSGSDSIPAIASILGRSQSFRSHFAFVPKQLVPACWDGSDEEELQLCEWRWARQKVWEHVGQDTGRKSTVAQKAQREPISSKDMSQRFDMSEKSGQSKNDG
jgi:hypothetical protein